ENNRIFEVGVAFIGKRPPASYQNEPWKRYEISSSSFQQMATAEEVQPIPTADQRVHTRHVIPVDLLLEIVDEKGEVVESEPTVTENISRKGATIFTSLQVPIGRFVRVTSAQYGLSVFAAIRSRSTGADGIPRIHVEFIDQEWPL
ncbi:MAG TPA: PilZ domain-containing protein, partial [Pyrinomonadaceae bacterium]|nr:PilZ domain-containing protein [Pyrinomonadaceae bacterium]